MSFQINQEVGSSSLQFFCGNWFIDVTSFRIQFEKIGLLREAFWSEGECFVSRKRVGKFESISPGKRV